eukprot:Gb_29110 [translate_table: standard]
MAPPLYGYQRKHWQQGGSMEENEVEEGEACEYLDDSNYDPDVDLSYIDDKLQEVLGHFQKDFEGGVSADKLGPKFGGYGSFLPSHERSPSVLLRPKTPILQNNSSQKIAIEGPVECIQHVAADIARTTPSTKGVSAANIVLSGPRALISDVANMEGSSGANGNGDDFPGKKKSVVKDVTNCDQKKFELHVKTCSDPVSYRKNTAIYSGLGFENSSSPSLEDSPHDNPFSSPEVECIPDPSPPSIIRIMTVHQIPVGSLLTPLRDSLIQLSERKNDPSVNDHKGRMMKRQTLEESISNRNESLFVNKLQGLKEMKESAKDKTERSMELKNEIDTELANKVSIKSKKTVEGNCKTSNESGPTILNPPGKSSSMEVFKEMTERKFTGDTGKENHEGLDQANKVAKGPPETRGFNSNSRSAEHKEVNRKGGLSSSSKAGTGLMIDSGREICLERGQNLLKEARGENSNRNYLSDKRKTVKDTASNGKKSGMIDSTIVFKKKKGCRDSINTSKEMVPGQDAIYEKAAIVQDPTNVASQNNRRHKDTGKDIHMFKETSKEKTRDAVRKAYKEPRKNRHQNESLPTGTSKTYTNGCHIDRVKDGGKEQVENGKDLIGISWKNSLNKSRSEQFEREHSSVSEGGMGRRHGIFKESESNNLVHASSSQAKASSTAVVPQPLPGGLSVTDAGLIQVDPVVINDNWVCCDVCEKWRLLPCGMEPSALPKKWLCRMLDWLPNMNHCDVSEDTTTQALYSMYAAQLGQGQNDANQGQAQLLAAPVSAPLFDAKSVEQNQESKVLNINKSGNRRKGHVNKSIINAPAATKFSSSLLMKNASSSVKKRSLNDSVHLPLKQAEGDGGNYEVAEKTKTKQKEKGKLNQSVAGEEHDAEVGDAPSKKLKRKSVDELGHKHAKKAKAGDAKCPNGNFLENANVIDQVGLGVGGTSAKLSGHRGNQRIGSCSPKEFRDEIIEGSLDADRRPKDQQQTSMQTDYSNFIPGSSGKRDHPTKKRKVRGWKEIQASQQDSAASMKEEHETEHTSPPKTKISKSEGMEHYVSKGDDKGERKGRAPRNFISSNRNLPKEMKEQNRGGFGKDHGMGRFCVREASQRALDATDWLKRDMGPRQPFVSAISSSSKVGVCGSPVESVSSSPWRTAKLDNLPSDLRNSGVDDLMDVNHLPSCSPARFSDDGEPQCDCSRSVGEAKISWVKQSGSCENHTGVECTTNNTGRVSGKNGKRDVRQLSAAKTNHDNPYTDAEHSNIHLVNIVKSSEQQERISDQKRKQHGVQEKSREYNLIDSSNERRGRRENLLNEGKIKKPKNVHDHVSESCQEHYIRARNVGNESEWNCYQEIYHEASGCVSYHKDSTDDKELSDGRVTYKTNTHKRENMKSKCNLRLKGLGGGEKGNRLVKDTDESIDIPPLDSDSNQQGKNFTRCGKTWEVHQKDGKTNSQEAPYHRGERALDLFLSDGNIQSGATSVRSKSQVFPYLEDTQVGQGHGSGAGIMHNKNAPPEGLAFDASSGESLRVLREPSKADCLHESLGCSLRPPASTGLSVIDSEGSFASTIMKEPSQGSANTAMKEAKHLKHCADRLKNTGVNELESTSLYFRAVLKFLHSASMLDLCNGNSDKQGETTQSMIVYTETARLCEFCALTYERNKEMAAAALAYKCMGVAHMRVAVAKNVLIRRDRHELQFVAQLVPPGESPSSPASDVDNLINHAVIHKDLSKNPARGVESAQVAGTPIFTARYRPHLRRILQFAQDVNSAVEAFAKADNAFISAKANMDDANCGPEGILAIKRAVDFSFHDVDGLLHLVRLAMEAIHH